MNLTNQEKDLILQIKKAFLDNEEQAQKSVASRMETQCQQLGINFIGFWVKKNPDCNCEELEVFTQKVGGKKHVFNDDELLEMFLGSFAVLMGAAQNLGLNVPEGMKDVIKQLLKGIIIGIVREEGKFIFNYSLDSPDFYKVTEKGGVKVNIAKYLSREIEKITM